MPGWLSKEMMTGIAAGLLLAIGLAAGGGETATLQVPDPPPVPEVAERPIEAFPNLQQALPRSMPPPPTKWLARNLFRPIEIWTPAEYPALHLPPQPEAGTPIPGGDIGGSLVLPGPVHVPAGDVGMAAGGDPSDEGGSQ